MNSMKADLIIRNATQLVTCASNGTAKHGAAMQSVGIIENGATAIKNGVIIAVGLSDEISRQYEADNVIDATNQVITPGYVECHTHIVFAGDRINEFELRIKGADYLEILANGGGIISTMRHTRTASAAELVEQSGQRLDKLLALGVTTCEVKTGYGLDTETEFKMLEAILELDRTHTIELVPTFLAAHAIPPEFKQNPDAYVDLICEVMLPKLKDRINLSTFAVNQCFVDVFCEKNAFSLAQSKRVLSTAKELGFGLKAHVDEFTNLGCAKFAIEQNAASIDHLDAISDAEITLLANSETIGVITPTVNFNFGSREFANARKMIDENCAIAISTDYNPGSAPCPSLPNAMAIACRYQKLLPSEALTAATVNAAFAVGLGDKVGSIEVGKQADLLILNAVDYRQIAYEFGGNCIDRVIKAGKPVNF